MTVGKGYEEWRRLDRSNRTAKYAVGGTVYFDYYFAPAFAAEAGLGFMSGGIRFKDADVTTKEAITFFEIPVMFKVDYKHLQGAAGLVLVVVK